MRNQNALGPGVVNLVGVVDGREEYLAVWNFNSGDEAVDLSGSTLTAGTVEAILEAVAAMGSGSPLMSLDVSGQGTPGLAELSDQAAADAAAIQSRGIALAMG